MQHGFQPPGASAENKTKQIKDKIQKNLPTDHENLYEASKMKCYIRINNNIYINHVIKQQSRAFNSTPVVTAAVITVFVSVCHCTLRKAISAGVFLMVLALLIEGLLYFPNQTSA